MVERSLGISIMEYRNSAPLNFGFMHPFNDAQKDQPAEAQTSQIPHSGRAARRAVVAAFRSATEA